MSEIFSPKVWIIRISEVPGISWKIFWFAPPTTLYYSLEITRRSRANQLLHVVHESNCIPVVD